MRFHSFRPGVTGLAAGKPAPSRARVTTETGTQPRNSLPEHVPYVYRGTGEDTLTAFMDDEPGEPVRCPTRREERMAVIARLRLNDRGGPVKLPPGTLTADQAAALLGVTRRTVERYKRELRGAS